MEAYELYKLYVSMKLHFTNNDYNFTKYNGLTTISEEAFQKRKDRITFEGLAKNLMDRDAIPFLLAMFIELNTFSPVYVLENPLLSNRLYNSWIERTKDLLSLYEHDIKTIAIRSNYSWRNAIQQKNSDYPLLFKLVAARTISPETYSLLDSLFNQTSKQYRDMDTDTLFLSLNLKFRKYRSFLTPTMEDLLRVTPRDLSELNPCSVK